MMLSRLVHSATRSLSPASPAPPEQLRTFRQAVVQQAGSFQWDNTLETTLQPGLGLPSSLPMEWPEAGLHLYEDVFTCGLEGSIWLRSGPSVDGFEQAPESFRRRRPIPLFARTISRPVLHLAAPNCENHGHFMLQVLPRWLALRKIYQEDPRTLILLPEKHARWQLRYLAAWGVDPERVVIQDSGTLHFKTLWHMPPRHGAAKLAEPEAYREMADALLPLDSDTDSTEPLQLFVSRAQAPDKRLLNEDEIVAAARRHFPRLQVVDLAHHTLAEQIHLFRRASLVLGPVGQGLAPLFLARRALCVIFTRKISHHDAIWSAAYHFLALGASGHSARIFARPQWPIEGQSWKPDPADLDPLFAQLAAHLADIT